MATTLHEFYDRLDRHDWTYAYSDDHSVYKRGRDAEAALGRVARESDAHQELYDAMRAYHLAMPNARPPKPVRPAEIVSPT